MLLCSDILQNMRQSDNLEKILQGITTKLLNLVQARHVLIYQLDKFTDDHNGMGISGKIVAEAIAPNCEPCTQGQIENLLIEEYQWGQSLTEQIIDLYNTGGARCEINLAEIFVGKAYLLVPIVLPERVGDKPLWGFLILHQCVVLDGESLQGAWDQDDVLMLQQIAMQIEIALQSESRKTSFFEHVQETEKVCATLRHSAEQYRFLVENIPSISYISPISNSLEFGYMSPQLRKILGVSVSEWNIEFLYSWAKHLHPDDSDRVQREYRHTIETGEPFCCEYRMLTSNGSIIWVRDTARILLAIDGKTKVLSGSMFDISDRKLIESKLLQNETLLKLTISNAPVGIATFDLQSKFLTVNQGFCQTFGYTDQELLNMTAIELTHPDYVEKTLTAIHLLVNHQATGVQVEKQYIHKHGHAIDVISRFGLVRDEHGSPIQFVAVIEDVTDRKLIEAKLIAAQIAEAENKSKGEFLAIMSHELRTPMNAVIGMTEILQRTALSRQQQQYVNTIRQGGEVLLSVINNILDFSRIESGHFELEERPFRLHQCIEEVLELMTSRTSEKCIELITFISLDVPQQLLGDYPRLRQILVNLVSNAIKFTESGEIVITVNSQLIDRETNTYELQFEVRDTGVGIAPDAISRLFKAFSQADNSIARQYGGTGLGLAICKQLCELMGGKIGVSSNLGVGSTFSFSIRVQSIIEDLATTTAIAPELKGKSVLCVNPNSTLQQAIALSAQPWGMNIQAAYTATEALQFLTTSTFEAVLIDRQLVEADGSEIDVLELAKSIQEIFPDLALILLTPINVVLNENTNSTYFKDCITKPISTSKLYQVFLNVFTNQKTIALSYQNLQPIPQASWETDNIVGDENFAMCYPFRILVVEDNPVNQKILLLMLENIGYQADAVENGQRAVNKFLSRAYDLIFMDIQMPIMNGLNATKTIRQIPNHQPWIIGLSANAFSESRESAMNAGMDDYLTKPLQTKSLIAALQRIPQRQHLFVDYSQPPINLSTLASIEDALGKEDLDELINVYLEHAASAIAKMKEAFAKQDFVAIESENHVLKGGSGTFGAIQLCSSCQALQSICKELIKSNEHTNEDIVKMASLLNNIEEQYNYVYQILQSRGFN